MPEQEERRELPLDVVRRALTAQFGAAKGEALFAQIKQDTEKRLGPESVMAITTPHIDRKALEALIRSDLFGIGKDHLINFDNRVQTSRVRNDLMLRFLKHYLQDEEWRALLTSLTLLPLLNDPEDKTPEYPPHLTVGSLYQRLNKLRYGRRIFNLVSTGRLQTSIYPEMRRTETRFNQAGRLPPGSEEAEIVRQIFYRAIQPDRTKYWLNAGTDVTEAFDRIHDSLFNQETPIPYLDVHGAGRAWELAQDVSALFIESFEGYTAVPHPQPDNPNAGYIRIGRKTTQ